MNSQRAHLSMNAVPLTQEQQAALARQLIAANEHYRLSNSDDVGLEERGQHRLQARILVEEVLGLDPDNATALNLLGRIDLDEGRAAEAAQHLEKAIVQEPDNAGFHLNLGYVRLAQRDYDQAEACFNRTLQLAPNSAQAYAGIAYALLRRGNYLGAFLRLRSLISKGYDNAHCRRALFDAAQHLWADRYDADLEADVLSYYDWSDLDAFKLGALTASLLVHKYDLGNPEARIDLDELLQDSLLLMGLRRSLLPNQLVERLLTDIRQSILVEAFDTRHLRDELQPMTCALAEYGARTGYAFALTDDEQALLDQLRMELHDAMQDHAWRHEDVIGALLVVAMYEPLYQQPYSHQLLRDDLADWPELAQGAMAAALYEPAARHMTEFDFRGARSALELAETPQVRGPAPMWETLAALPRSDYRQALARELGQDSLAVREPGQPLRILVTGCRSGQRAIGLARFFEGVDITAVDANLDNVVHGLHMARAQGLENIRFQCLPLSEIAQAGEAFDVIECGSPLGAPGEVVANMRRLADLLAPGGVIRFTLPRRAGRLEIEEARARLKAHDVLPTPENVRTVRQIMLDETSQGLWQDIVANAEFYTLPGARDLLFTENEPSYNLREVHGLLQAAGLSFVGFVDLDPISRQRVRTLNPRDLMAWHSLDESQQTVFGQSYELYCRKG